MVETALATALAVLVTAFAAVDPAAWTAFAAGGLTGFS
jgi:hypothetical protein